MRPVTHSRHRGHGVLAGMVLAIAALVACNALTGVDSLSTASCPACEPGGSSGSGGDAQTSSGGDAAKVDGSFDGPGLPTAAGSLDTSFGIGGVVVSGLLDTVTSVAIRPDGRIVVGGSSAGQLAVARFEVSGAPDVTFGGNGRVTAGNLTSSRADAIAIDSQGRILAGGLALNVDVAGVTTQFAYLVRLNDSGLDKSFAGAGRKAFTTDGEAITSLVVLPTDECIVGGRALASGRTLGAIWQLSATGAFLVVNGVGRTDITYVSGSPSTITAMIGNATSFLIVGSVTPLLGTSDFAAARFAGNALDTSFDGDGRVVVPVGTNADTALAVASFSDGTYLLGGEVGVPANGGATPRTQLGLVRLQHDSTLSPLWATGGKSIGTFEPPGLPLTGAGDYLRGVAVDKQDRAVAVGFTEEADAAKHRAAALRLDANGQRDLLFGSFGIVGGLFDATSSDTRATAVALQADGKIVVVGTSAGQLAITRINP